MKRISLIGYRRLSVIVLSMLFVSFVAVASISAQSGESTALDENSASLSIVETIPVTASVEVNINGQIYKLAIPVTVNIDTQKDLADALLTAQAVDVVGDLQWIITNIAEYEEEYEFNDFNTFTPSTPENKLVVIDSELTNLDSDPFNYYLDTGDLLAYDEQGNLYESFEGLCSDINPGNTQSCTLVFDVPMAATIQGMDVEVLEHKRIPFSAQE